MTLGADRLRVVYLFLRRAGILAGLGLGLGVIGALAGAIITRSMVFGISPLSPTHLAMAAGVMILVILAATMVPVRKATGVDPLEALRID